MISFWYLLILRGKQKEKKTKTPEYKVPPHFSKGRNKKPKTVLVKKKQIDKRLSTQLHALL